jgi:hypothetical protein
LAREGDMAIQKSAKFFLRQIELVGAPRRLGAWIDMPAVFGQSDASRDALGSSDTVAGRSRTHGVEDERPGTVSGRHEVQVTWPWFRASL